MNFDELFARFGDMKVAVIGDVMLDTYWWGRVDRISPEAPVPIVALNRKEYRIGGAGNVALNTAAFGARTTLFSIVGDDGDANILMELLEQQEIDTSNLSKSVQRLTTNKIRVVGKSQQMMRLDIEVTDDITATEEQELLMRFEAYVKAEQPDVVIFEDYNKGVITPSLIKAVTVICKANGIVTAVDPKRKNFFAFAQVDIFKPNLKEVREGLNLIEEDVAPEMLRNIHKALAEKLQHHISFITLSEKGVFFDNNDTAAIIPSHIRNIADVSGAGDTVIAVASLVYAATRDVLLMAEVANIAGGLVCEEIGTAVIKPSLLFQECCRLVR